MRALLQFSAHPDPQVISEDAGVTTPTVHVGAVACGLQVPFPLISLTPGILRDWNKAGDLNRSQVCACAPPHKNVKSINFNQADLARTGYGFFAHGDVPCRAVEAVHEAVLKVFAQRPKAFEPPPPAAPWAPAPGVPRRGVLRECLQDLCTEETLHVVLTGLKAVLPRGAEWDPVTDHIRVHSAARGAPEGPWFRPREVGLEHRIDGCVAWLVLGDKAALPAVVPYTHLGTPEEPEACGVSPGTLRSGDILVAYSTTIVSFRANAGPHTSFLLEVPFTVARPAQPWSSGREQPVAWSALLSKGPSVQQITHAVQASRPLRSPRPRTTGKIPRSRWRKLRITHAHSGPLRPCTKRCSLRAVRPS